MTKFRLGPGTGWGRYIYHPNSEIAVGALELVGGPPCIKPTQHGERSGLFPKELERTYTSVAEAHDALGDPT